MRVAIQLAFPEDDYAPSQRLERSSGSAIAGNIALELGQPIALPGPWLSSVATAWVLVPEAAMHEDRDAMSRQDDVRRARKVTAMQTESIAQRV